MNEAIDAVYEEVRDIRTNLENFYERYGSDILDLEELKELAGKLTKLENQIDSLKNLI